MTSKLTERKLNRLESNQDAAPSMGPVDVFVSYCHKDKFWKDWLLEGRLSAGSATTRFWSDDEIRPSDDWSKEIKNSLEGAKVAVLLVSRNFLKSQFIREIELPSILMRRQKNQSKILWVSLESGMRNLQKTELPGIQGVWPVSSPLKPIQENEPTDVLNAVRDRLHDYILRELDLELWRVRHVFPKPYDKYEVIRRMGEGASRSVYLGHDHALKRFVSIVTLKRREDLDDFEDSLLHASRVEDIEVFMTVYEAGLRTDPPFYVRQYIKGQTLHERLKHGSLPLRHARDIILRLGKAVDAAHRRGFFHLNIKPSNILFDGQDNTFLSALSRRHNYFDWLKNNWSNGGIDNPSEEDKAYAIPEFFRGQVVLKESLGKCDQYLLGLLGYHMITGKLPERVSLTKVPKLRSDFGDLAAIHDFEVAGCVPRLLPIRLCAWFPRNLRNVSTT
jgi:Protein kinase domain/TIR domain